MLSYFIDGDFLFLNSYWHNWNKDEDDKKLVKPQYFLKVDK
jgi:hypothetical protein